MHQFNNRSNDMTMRVSSLDYLGQIASRLRKHAVSSNMDQDTLDTIVSQVNAKENYNVKIHTLTKK